MNSAEAVLAAEEEVGWTVLMSWAVGHRHFQKILGRAGEAPRSVSLAQVD